MSEHAVCEGGFQKFELEAMPRSSPRPYVRVLVALNLFTISVTK